MASCGLLAVCFVICFMGTVITASEFNKCKNNQPVPLSVDIEGCDKAPCIVIKGRTAWMDVHFVGIKNEIKKLTTEVYATALGVTVPYEVPSEIADVCRNLKYGAQCPIYGTEDVVYRFVLFIDSLYPEISVKVQVSLVDEDRDTVACFSVDAKIRKGSTNTTLLN